MTSRMHYDGAEDTIVAPATGFGRGAVGIVRVSGPLAVDVLRRLFRPAGRKPLEAIQSHHLYFGRLHAPDGELLDECLAVAMLAPRSYTGEDVVEFHLHGSTAVAQSVLDACVAAGCRLARPGEFTLRAFLNGRLDLSQAEGVANLVAAQTAFSQRIALRQLSGGVSQKIIQLRERLLDATAELEAWIDFPEEEIPAPALEKHTAMLEEIASELKRLLGTHRIAKLALGGARVVLVGAPNAGKSSLFNALIGRERAIVTPHPGTTRDTIESTVDLRGLPVTLVDTAGLRETADAIEALGIERSRNEAAQADLILWIIDTTAPFNYECERKLLPDCEAGHMLAVLNKMDTADPRQADCIAAELEEQGHVVVRVSCLNRSGFDELEDALYTSLSGGQTLTDEVYITNARHADCLERALHSIDQAIGAMRRGESPEFVSIDLREALDQLGSIVGIGTSEEILDRIFSRFCIGK